MSTQIFGSGGSSVCGDAPCRTMEVEGAIFEEIPEAIIVKAALIAAAESIGKTA